MKGSSQKFINKIGVLLSYIFPYSLFVGGKKIKARIFSGYIKRQFNSVGENFLIMSPINLHGGQYIEIGDNFGAGARLRIEAYDHFLNDQYSPKITIGNNVTINFDCHIGCINHIRIGNGVLIASKVLIIDHFHGEIIPEALKQQPLQRTLSSKGGIIIGDNVWIGESCAIMPGVKLGENCIVGSNSVVTKSFGANCIVAGNPARLIKHLE
ncbi:MAG: acyltransferase [Mucilaginibacter sp.]|uniref:acyltransferase n=1 Tax=Mucilaginibacter sp. TaxID=1882438 RepID=UPI0032673776